MALRSARPIIASLLALAILFGAVLYGVHLFSAPANVAGTTAELSASAGPALPQAAPPAAQAGPSAPAVSSQQAHGGVAAPAEIQPLATATPAPVVRTVTSPRVYRVGLQVGHYKNNELPPQLSRIEGNTGTYGGGRSEVIFNLEIANRVAELLRAQGIVVDILPATVPTGYNADAFIAIHADGNSSPSARGFKISTRWRSTIAVQDASLVNTLTEVYAAVTGLPEDYTVTANMRGYYAYSSYRPNYRTSNYTPSAIVETGFMTSPADRAVLFNQAARVATGIAMGIEQFLQVAYSSPSAQTAYGYGIVDKDIKPNAPEPPQLQHQRPNAAPPPFPLTRGDWQVLVLGDTAVNVRSAPTDSPVIAKLPPGLTFYHATQRKGSYYLVTLPGGRQGWVNRMVLLIQG